MSSVRYDYCLLLEILMPKITNANAAITFRDCQSVIAACTELELISDSITATVVDEIIIYVCTKLNGFSKAPEHRHRSNVTRVCVTVKTQR
jgi:hypothetical protein